MLKKSYICIDGRWEEFTEYFPDYLDRTIHCDYGPAIISKDGSREWYRHGQLHREDGPAIIRPTGTNEWYFNGLLHREEGPAAQYSNGSLYWFIHGEKHREDGPASIKNNGEKMWWINDIDITLNVEEWIRENDLPPYEEWDKDIKMLFKLTWC